MVFQSIENCPCYLVSRVYPAVTPALKKGMAASGVKNVKPAYIGALFTLWSEKSLGSSMTAWPGPFSRGTIRCSPRRGPDPDPVRGVHGDDTRLGSHGPGIYRCLHSN